MKLFFVCFLTLCMTPFYASDLSVIEPFLNKYCLECHDNDVQKGDLNLEDFGIKSDLRTLFSVYDQTILEVMPPEKKAQPNSTLRQQFVEAVEELLSLKGMSRKLEPGYGNYIQHQKLFSPTTLQASTPKRIWRIDPSAFAELANQLIGKVVYKQMRQGVSKEDPSFNYRTPPHAFKDFASVNTFEDTTTELAFNYAKDISKNIIEHNSKLSKEQLIQQTYRRLFSKDIPKIEFDKLNHFDTQSALIALILNPNTVYRVEDQMDSFELARTLGYSLSENGPDADLYQQVENETLEDVINDRMSKSEFNWRLVRFMREYFEYDKAADVFKDPKDHPVAPANRSKQYRPHYYIEDADYFCLSIIEEDKNVLKQLLTSSKYNVKGGLPRTHGKAPKRADANFYRYGYHGNYGIAEHELKPWRDSYEVKNRMGILHHPAWLISFSDNEKNQAIQRGRWVTTKLLGGYVPDAPVAVDAQLPTDPHKTLREKMVVTTAKECWACHKNMDEQGLPFEQFDFIGQYRNNELLKPIVSTGVLKLPREDKTEVLQIKDPYAYVEILSESKHVQQVFLRHVFRFFMGRNETLHDASTLQAMDRAYSKQGSLKTAVKVLLMSDSYLKRI